MGARGVSNGLVCVPLPLSRLPGLPNLDHTLHSHGHAHREPQEREAQSLELRFGRARLVIVGVHLLPPLFLARSRAPLGCFRRCSCAACCCCRYHAAARCCTLALVLLCSAPAAALCLGELHGEAAADVPFRLLYCCGSAWCGAPPSAELRVFKQYPHSELRERLREGSRSAGDS